MIYSSQNSLENGRNENEKMKTKYWTEDFNDTKGWQFLHNCNRRKIRISEKRLSSFQAKAMRYNSCTFEKKDPHNSGALYQRVAT